MEIRKLAGLEVQISLLSSQENMDIFFRANINYKPVRTRLMIPVCLNKFVARVPAQNFNCMLKSNNVNQHNKDQGEVITVEHAALLCA